MTDRPPIRTTVELPWGPVSCLSWLPDADPTGPDVLLLHGAGLDSAELSWGEVGPALAASGQRVFASDHPGYGQTPPPPWRVTQERLVAYVSEVVDALGLSHPVVGGLSLGGGLTLGHLLARPGDTRATLLLGTYGVAAGQFSGPLAGFYQALTWASVHSGLLKALTRVSVRSPRLLASFLGNVLADPASRTPELLATLTETAASTDLAAWDQWQRDQVLPRRLRTVYTDALPTIDVPVLVVHGSRDAGVPVDAARNAARLAAGGRPARGGGRGPLGAARPTRRGHSRARRLPRPSRPQLLTVGRSGGEHPRRPGRMAGCDQTFLRSTGSA